jgi:hypothetical protein
MQEIISKRGRNTKVYDLGNGVTRVSTRISAFHYQDINGDWQEIDSTIKSSSGGYDYENTANEFSCKFKSNLNSPDSILFSRGGVSVSLRPIGVALYDASSKNHTILANAGDTTATVDGNLIYFTGLYPNVIVGYMITDVGMKEFIRVSSPNGVPDPTTLGYDPETTYLVLINRITVTGADSQEDEKGALTEGRDLGIVHFIKNSVSQIRIPQLLGWFEGRHSAADVMKKRIKIINGTPYFLHGVSYNKFISARRYPYIIDTSLSIDVNSGADDGFYSNVNGWVDSTYLIVGATSGKDNPYYNIAVRFTNVTIPNNATINSAYLTLVCYFDSNPDTNYVYISGDDVDNSGALSSTHNYQIGFTPTSAFVGWTLNAITQNTSYQSPDIKDIIAEITSRPGWSSGNSLSLGIYNNATNSVGNYYSFCSYDISTTYAPQLDVDYTATGDETIIGPFPTFLYE